MPAYPDQKFTGDRGCAYQPDVGQTLLNQPLHRPPFQIFVFA